ncbi:membrane metallo-endopeptidase-like 1, partial [Trichonephila clavata]
GAILDKLDQTVHPCKDFYQFACGNYIRRTVLPENMDVMSVIQNMEDEVLMIIFRALESPTLYRTGGSLIKAKMLYETCMNSDTLEDDSVQVLRLFLSERGVGHWPVLDADWSSGDMNLEWRLAMLFVHHTPVFFHMYADAPSFYSEYILNVYPASSPLGAKEVSGADRERIFEAYHKLLIETLRLLGVPEVRVQADSFDIIGFELQFSMITNTSQQCLLQSNKDANETREDDTRLYNVTVDDLEYHIPQIKWSRLMSYVFRNLGLPLDTSSLYVMVHCKEYFKQLGTLLSNTPPRTLANYMSWKFVLSYMSFMSMPFRQIFQDYTLLTPELKHSKLKTYTSRWKGCVSLVGSWFGNAIAAYYASMATRETLNRRERGTLQRSGISYFVFSPVSKLESAVKYEELSGGHNYCRNPGGVETQPWCFIADPHMKKEICDIPTLCGIHLVVHIPAILGGCHSHVCLASPVVQKTTQEDMHF